MPLLLTRDDLRPLLTDPDLIDGGLAAIAGSLTAPACDDAEHDWLAFPLAEGGTRLNLNVLTTTADATSLRIWPTARDSAAEHALTVLFDRSEGRPVAIMSNGSLLMWRTAGPVMLACRHLAPPGATTVAMLGSGVQARHHLIGLRRALPSLREIRVYSPHREHRERYASDAAATGLGVIAVDTAEAAVTGADVVCNTAGSTTPVFDAAWIRPGALVTEIFLGTPNDLEARIVLPTVHAIPTRSVPGLDPHPEARDHLPPPAADTTLAEVLRGDAPARLRPDETVLYRLLGVYPWDAALTAFAYRWAHDHRIGTFVDL
jgi:alanine dehydrogenase